MSVVHETAIEEDSAIYAQPIRVISLRKSSGQPLVRENIKRNF